MILSEMRNSLSYWHESGALLGRACSMYVGDGPGKLPIIVKDLLRAQYIDAMLGLQGVPIVDVRTLSGDPVTLGPINLIHWLCRRHPELTPDRMRELRLVIMDEPSRV